MVGHHLADVQRHATSRIAQQNFGVINRLPARFQHGKVGADRVRPSEQHQRLIDKMRPDVLPDPTGAPILPAFAQFGPETVETAFESGDLAQSAIGNQAAQREEIGVPTTIVKH